MTQVVLYPGLTTDVGTLKKADLEPVHVAAARWAAVSGAVNLSSSSSIAPAWMFDKDATEVIGARVQLPSFWSTFLVKIHLVNSASSSGDVILFGSLNFTGDGDDLSAGRVTWLSNAAAITVPSTIAVEKVVSGTSGLAATSGKWCNVKLQRTGADALDTLANDVGFLGVTFVPLTTT
jgi:hypothetical protein